MVLDLIAGDRRLDLVDGFAKQRKIEIADADRPRFPVCPELFQRLEDRSKIHGPGGPVHEIEIDVVEPQFFQAGIKRPADRVGSQVFVPDLGGDVKLLAHHARCSDSGTARILVTVHLCRIDVAIAETERAFDGRAADVSLHPVGAKPEARQIDALCMQIGHEDSRNEKVTTRAGSRRR